MNNEKPITIDELLKPRTMVGVQDVATFTHTNACGERTEYRGNVPLLRSALTEIAMHKQGVIYG